MNVLKRLIIALALVASFSTASLVADGGAGNPPANGASDTAKSDKAPRANRVKDLAKALGLSEEQEKQVAAIYKAENAAVAAVNDNDAFSRSEKVAKNRVIREEHASQIRALLTPEQLATFDGMNAPKSKKKGASTEENS